MEVNKLQDYPRDESDDDNDAEMPEDEYEMMDDLDDEGLAEPGAPPCGAGGGI